MPSYTGEINLTTQSDQFLKKYAPTSVDVYDAGTPVMMSLPKTFNHQGSDFNQTLNLSFGGGRGAGSLPTPSNWKTERTTFARKSLYYRGRLDRQALFASKEGGAVENLFELVSRLGPQGFRGMVERALFAPKATDGSSNVVGSGKLGTITGVSAVGAVYTLTIANDFKAANFEIGDLVNIETGDTNQFEVQEIDTAATTVTVERTTGVQVPVATDEIFLQGSEDKDLLGVHSLVDFASGESLYGVPYGYRYAPTRVNGGAAAVTLQMIEDAILQIGELTGEAPDLAIVNREQWSAISAQMQTQKRYNVTKPQRNIKGHIGFKGFEFITPYGTTTIMLSRYADSDRVYLINTKYWELKHSMGFGWFRDHGNVFLTRQDEDELEVRFGGYMEFYGYTPAYHGVVYNLST